MAKLTRIAQKLFGSNAAAGQIGQFGSLAAGSPTTTTDAASMMSLSNWLGGWFSAVVGGNSPAIEDMNSVCYVFSRQLAYLFQTGVAEWDSGTTYYTGCLASSNGVLYVSLTDNNTNHAVTDGANWSVFGGEVKTVSTTYSALVTDKIIRADATSAAFTITLPTVATALGKILYIKRINTNSNLVTIHGNGAELIDGANTLTIDGPYDTIQLVCNGSSWDVL